MKLRRLYEQAEEQDRPVQEVALERYGSLDEFNEAVEERKFLDEKESRRRSRRGGSDAGYHSSGPSSGMRTPDMQRKFVFNNSDESRPASRQGFRRPGEERDGTPGASRVDALRRQESGTRITPLKDATPIPSVFTPQALTRGTSGEPGRPIVSTDGKPIFTLEQLNRLQAKVLRAKLTDDPDAEALEEQYELERARFDDAGGVTATTGNIVREDEKGNTVQVEVLPTLDGQGRLYDLGQGKEDAVPQGKRNREKKVSRSLGPTDNSLRRATSRAILSGTAPMMTMSLLASLCGRNDSVVVPRT